MKSLQLLLIIFSLLTTHYAFSQQVKNKKGLTPTSIDDFTCGRYQLTGRIMTLPDGSDYFVFYPQSNKEFMVPLRGLDLRASLQYDQAEVTITADLPLKNGRRQGRFYLQQVLRVADEEHLHHTPAQLISSTCRSL